MRIALFVNTPAQAHFIKNLIKILSGDGHTVYILSREYGETISVLDELNIAHFVYSKPKKSKMLKIMNFPLDILNAFLYLRNKDLDLIFGFGINETYTGILLNKPVVVFTDSESIVNKITFSIQFSLFIPFVDVVITPTSFRQDIGEKQIRVNSYKELAYLHPKYYHTNDNIFDLLGIKRNEDYVLLRFNAFDAVHDAGIKGFKDEDKSRLVSELEKYAKVFISSETNIPDNIRDRIAQIPKSRIHDALYYAKLLVTDTQTMTTEAALLGTPAVRCNRFVNKNDMGNFIELENQYGLIYNFDNSNDAIEKAILLVRNPNLKEEWIAKRKRVLEDKSDMTSFIVEFLESFPLDS